MQSLDDRRKIPEILVGNTMSDSESNTMRVDKWLWMARFFKARGLASEAVQGGHVHVNGMRGKASRTVKVGDELEITRSPFVFHITIERIPARRGPASEAQTLYTERPESIATRTALAEERRLHRQASPSPDKRPDKRSRRHIIRFINKNQA